MGIKSRFVQTREFIVRNKENLVICAEFVLVAAMFFGLGVLYDKNILKDNSQINVVEPAARDQVFVSSTPASLIRPKEKSQTASISNALAQARNFVASKNGTVYYALICKNNIKEENKIYFQTKEDADKAGFQPAKNCFK